jgi:hypothetical protein
VSNHHGNGAMKDSDENSHAHRKHSPPESVNCVRPVSYSGRQP